MTATPTVLSYCWFEIREEKKMPVVSGYLEPFALKIGNARGLFQVSSPGFIRTLNSWAKISVQYWKHREMGPAAVGSSRRAPWDSVAGKGSANAEGIRPSRWISSAFAVSAPVNYDRLTWSDYKYWQPTLHQWTWARLSLPRSHLKATERTRLQNDEIFSGSIQLLTYESENISLC